MSLSMQASVDLPAPFPAHELREFFATVPDNALTTVSTRMGGDQRDPYPVGYLIQAKWEAEK